MECDKDKETSPPESPPVMEDTILDDNQDDVDTEMTTTAATAVATGTKDPEANTDAQTPVRAAMAAYLARNANTLANTAKRNSPLGWGQGHVVNASAYVPDDSETTAEARNMVINGLAQTHPDDVDESVLDNNVEFVLSRLSRHESDVRQEWTAAMAEVLQRVNPLDVVLTLDTLRELFSDTEIAGIRAFSLRGAGNTMFTVPAEFMARHLVPSMIMNKVMGDILPKHLSDVSGGEGEASTSHKWKSVDIVPLLTAVYGDLRMRTWIQDNVGPHCKDGDRYDDNGELLRADSDLGNVDLREEERPRVADMKSLNVLADANRGFKEILSYQKHMEHMHGASLAEILEEFEGIMAAAANKSGYSRTGDKELLSEHKERAETLCDQLKMYLDKLIVAEKSVLVVNQTNYDLTLENERLIEERISLQKLHEKQLEEKQHEASRTVVNKVNECIADMELLRWQAVEAIKSQKLIPDVEDVVVDDETYKHRWEKAQRLNNTLSQRLNAQSYANAVVTERLNASNLRMAMLPVPQLKELLEADVSTPSALLSKALHEQRDYGRGLKYFKGEFSTWQEPAKGSINLQSYAKIISPGLCISPSEQTEAKALEELWKTTKGMVYKPNPPVEVAGIAIVARDTIPKKSVGSSSSSPGAAATYASAASRSSSSTTTSSRLRRSTSPIRKRRAPESIRFDGPYRFWLDYSPKKEEFMNEAHTCWSLDIERWAYPDLRLQEPHPWSTPRAKDEFDEKILDIWARSFSLMCEAHTRPETIVDEIPGRDQYTSTYEWLSQPQNRQRPPQILSQLRSSGLFSQTLRLPDPMDSFNDRVAEYIMDRNTLSYLRVILKPNKKYAGSEYTRTKEESFRIPGHNDRVQYKPAKSQERHPSYPVASDLFRDSGMAKNGSLRRSTIAVSDTALLHELKSIKHGEGRSILYKLYMFLPASMVDIKGHLIDLRLQVKADHYMSDWAESKFLSYTTEVQDQKSVRSTHLDIPRFLVAIFGNAFAGLQYDASGERIDWSGAPENFPLEDLYCKVEEWLFHVERCMYNTSMRMYCAWSELHFTVYERHRHRLMTLYSIMADSFDLIAHQPPMMHSTEHRPRFNFELFKEVHTAPRRTAQNPKPCSYLFGKHITISRWTCRRGGRFTRPPYAGNPPTSVTASLQNKDAGQE